VSVGRFGAPFSLSQEISAMKKIDVTFVETAVLDDLRVGTALEEKYEANTAYNLDPHTAVRWVRRRKAFFNSPADAEAARDVTGWSAPDTILPADGEAGEADQVELTFDNMTVAKLRAHAEASGIDLGDATKKADIIAVIKASK